MALEEQDLAVHLFAPMDGPLAESAWIRLRRLWSECGASLGMTEDIPPGNLSSELPCDLRDLPCGAVVAGRQSPGAGLQAVLRREHDVLSLSVLLAGRTGRGTSPPLWTELARRWEAADDASAGQLIGSALIYLAKTADPASADLEMASLLPDPPEAGWRQTAVTMGTGLVAWETSAQDDLRADRRFVFVARHDAEDEISAWTWSRGDAVMPSFARYLMHMAKIRYELRVHAWYSGVAPLCRDASDAVAAVRDLVGSAPVRSGGNDHRILLDGQLAALRRNGLEMAELSMLLKAMRQTAEIAGANAMDALGAGLADQSERNFAADDRAVARSLLNRLDDDVAYLTVSLEGVRQVSELASGDRSASVRAHRQPNRRGGLAVVVCALNVEYLAMRAHLTDLRARDHPAGTRFDVGELAGSDWLVALVITGPGNIGAAILTERAIALFSPDVVLCVGVAGSLKETIKLGDVVVATRVDAYHGGTASEHFLARPRSWDAPHRLDQAARALVRSPTWWERLPSPPAGEPPVVHFSPIATGEVVLDSREAELYVQLHLHYNDAVAIEMESAGIAQAAHFNDSLPALVIRGISDQADGTKAAADRAGGQQRASVNAAAFAVVLLASLTPSAWSAGR